MWLATKWDLEIQEWHVSTVYLRDAELYKFADRARRCGQDTWMHHVIESRALLKVYKGKRDPHDKLPSTLQSLIKMTHRSGPARR